MTENIRPGHYRQGKIDLFEAWYQTYPYEQWVAIMQSHAEKYLRRDKTNRVEDLDKAIYVLQRLKEKEIEHAESYQEVETKDGVITFKCGNIQADSIRVWWVNITLLSDLQEWGYKYLARDENGDLWAHNSFPHKHTDGWSSHNYIKKIANDPFPEVKWSDEEPTKISDLLETYENGGN